MAVQPNVNVREIRIYKMFWGLKGATEVIQQLRLLMSRADPTSLHGPSSVADSYRLAIRARFPPRGKRLLLS